MKRRKRGSTGRRRGNRGPEIGGLSSSSSPGLGDTQLGMVQFDEQFILSKFYLQKCFRLQQRQQFLMSTIGPRREIWGQEAEEDTQ